MYTRSLVEESFVCCTSISKNTIDFLVLGLCGTDVSYADNTDHILNQDLFKGRKNWVLLSQKATEQILAMNVGVFSFRCCFFLSRYVSCCAISSWVQQWMQ